MSAARPLDLGLGPAAPGWALRAAVREHLENNLATMLEGMRSLEAAQRDERGGHDATA